jgi:hypothetical protein
MAVRAKSSQVQLTGGSTLTLDRRDGEDCDGTEWAEASQVIRALPALSRAFCSRASMSHQIRKTSQDKILTRFIMLERSRKRPLGSSVRRTHLGF